MLSNILMLADYLMRLGLISTAVNGLQSCLLAITHTGITDGDAFRPLLTSQACLLVYLTKLTEMANPTGSQQLPLIVVMGVTGRQGKATAAALVHTKQFRVIGISRTPDSDESKSTHQELGVQIVKADAMDKASLVSAFKGAWGVFGLTNPFTRRWSPKSLLDRNVEQGSVEGEVQQGKNIVEACKETGVQHLVFTSCASALENTGVPTFEAKAEVERYIAAQGPDFRRRTTILGPCGFFENLVGPYGIKQGSIPSFLKNKRAQMVACSDIGWFAARAFEAMASGEQDKMAQWAGARIELAGDTVSAEEEAEILSKLRGGEPWTVSSPPEWVFKLFIPKAVGSLRTFLQEKGTHVDVEAVRKIHPGLQDFKAFCIAQGLDKKQLPQPSYCAVM